MMIPDPDGKSVGAGYRTRRHPMKTRVILAMAAAGCGVVILFAQQRPAGPYTQD
jgi:hypothetical protein